MRRKRMRFAVEIVRRVREACGPDFILIYRLSMLDLVDGGGDWDDIVQQAQAIEAAGATHHQHRHRLARSAHPDDRHLGAARGIRRRDREAAPARALAAGHHQSHQHARRRRSRARRRRRRHGVDGAPAARRSAMGEQGARRTRACDQHLHRVQPGVPGPRVREQARELPGESARVRGNRNGRLRAPRRRAASPSSARAPRAWRARPKRPRAATASTCSKAAMRSAASSTSRSRIPGKEEFEETLRYFRHRIEETGVDAASSNACRSGQRCRITTRSSSPPA